MTSFHKFPTEQKPYRNKAELLSRRLPTAAARVRAQDRSCGICGGQSGIGAGFFRVLRLSLCLTN
jgi:hypothetical protein